MNDPLTPGAGAIPLQMTYDQFCALWPMSRSSLARRIDDGRIRVLRDGQLCRITRDEFLRLRRAQLEAGGRPVHPEGE